MSSFASSNTQKIEDLEKALSYVKVEVETSAIISDQCLEDLKHAVESHCLTYALSYYKNTVREQTRLYQQVGPVAYSLLSSLRVPRGTDIKSE